MNDKEKVVFKKYDLKLKRREYRLLVPVQEITEGYVYLYHDNPYIEGNNVLFETLRGAAVTLTRDPKAIIYLPLRKNGSIATNYIDNEPVPNYDVVLYCHNAQLNRHHFGLMKKMLKYATPVPVTTSYSIKSVSEYCKREYHAYEKSKEFYSRDGWRIYEEATTVFSEGSHFLACNSFTDVLDYTKDTNMEAEVRKMGYAPYGWAFGCGLGYMSRTIKNFVTEKM